MAQSGQRKCLCCGRLFYPDRRNRERQRYCADGACRRASKAASQSAWISQRQNAGYFRDPVHVARVQAWRMANPGYGRGRPRRPMALQDSLIAQLTDAMEESTVRTELAAAPDALALQDPLEVPSPVLVGLIAHLFEVTLQEDIAATTRRLVQLGRDVINRSQHEDSQTSIAA